MGDIVENEKNTFFYENPTVLGITMKTVMVY